MSEIEIFKWENTCRLPRPVQWKCWLCERETANDRGFIGALCRKDGGHQVGQGFIAICPYCGTPAFFPIEERQEIYYPASLPGSNISGLPEDIEEIYRNARTCISAGAFTSAVLTFRKLLMHIAVSRGAKPGMGFTHYANWIIEQCIVPKNHQKLVNYITKRGNEENHRIQVASKEDAMLLLDLTERLLSSTYEVEAIEYLEE